MQLQDCDVSPMKELVKKQLRQIADELQRSLKFIDDENHCLLSDFDEIREMFKQMESMAASFYLQCYLSSFTTSYLDLSIAIQHLSKSRHGALIVIKRDDSLDGVIHSGITLEASLTSPLLESIFYPGNPLHDGAVLIMSDRIVSAANVLPLSNTTIFGKKMGTRHRAAIGLTEQADALVLVVSEETGNASFAYKGILHPLNIVKPITQPDAVHKKFQA
jgi:diadenylate cyclase